VFAENVPVLVTAIFLKRMEGITWAMPPRSRFLILWILSLARAFAAEKFKKTSPLRVSPRIRPLSPIARMSPLHLASAAGAVPDAVPE